MLALHRAQAAQSKTLMPAGVPLGILRLRELANLKLPQAKAGYM